MISQTTAVVIAWVVVAVVFLVIWNIVRFRQHCVTFLAALGELGGKANTLQIHRQSGMPLWRIYVIANHLEEAGVVVSSLEPGGPERGGRRRRVIERIWT